MSTESPSRRSPDKLAKVRAMSRRIVRIARPAAKALGYAIGLHGSLERDVDLIAVPWAEDAAEPLAVVKAIQDAITDEIGICYRSKEPEAKPHGRFAWTLYFHGAVSTTNGAFPFVDLSVLPRAAQ